MQIVRNGFVETHHVAPVTRIKRLSGVSFLVF